MHGRDLSNYRPNVGVALFNAEGLVFIGKRTGKLTRYSWQMPQGGMDPGEDAAKAALRELKEETGVAPTLVEPLAEIEDWLVYDFPASVRTAKRTQRKGHWRGQKQRWFALRFLGSDEDVDLFADDHPEFDEWRWARLGETPDLIIPWKRRVYQSVADAFAPFAAD